MYIHVNQPLVPWKTQHSSFVAAAKDNRLQKSSMTGCYHRLYNIFILPDTGNVRELAVQDSQVNCQLCRVTR